MEKTDFRKAYEEVHDLCNDALEIVGQIYDEKVYEKRRDLITNLRNTMNLITKQTNTLAAGEGWTHAIEEKKR